MTFWAILGIIFVAGGIGGVVNALMSDNGFVLPKPIETNGGRIFKPGFLANILIGGVAAAISWGIYGPFASYALIGATTTTSAGPVILTLSALVGAVLVGVGGSRWLTNEVDKKMLRVAASQAAGGPADNNTASQIMTASPSEALTLTKMSS